MAASERESRGPTRRENTGPCARCATKAVTQVKDIKLSQSSIVASGKDNRAAVSVDSTRWELVSLFPQSAGLQRLLKLPQPPSESICLILSQLHCLGVPGGSAHPAVMKRPSLLVISKLITTSPV